MKSILILIVLSLSNYSLAAVDKNVLKKHFEEADKLVSKVDILNLGTQCFDQNDDKKGLIVKTEVVAAKWPLFPEMKYDIVLGEYLSPTVTLEKGSTQYGDTDIITKIELTKAYISEKFLEIIYIIGLTKTALLQ
jgi:hypothetical protein